MYEIPQIENCVQKRRGKKTRRLMCRKIDHDCFTNCVEAVLIHDESGKCASFDTETGNGLKE